MSKQTSTLIQATVAAVLLAFGTVHAAPQADIAKLPRVVVAGKASVVAVLPRVVVTGVSLNTQMERMLLASAKPMARAL